jgi:hypothetical protein
MEDVQDLVWLRRVVYFATLVLLVIGLCLPFFAAHIPALTVDQALTAPVRMLTFIPRALLPGFVDNWFTTIETRPITTIVFGLFLTGCLLTSHQLAVRIKDLARNVWTSQTASPPTTWLRRLARTIRTNRAVQDFAGIQTKLVLPTVALVLAGLLVLAVLNRVLYEVVDGLGGYCSASANAVEVDGVQLTSKPFDISEICWASGLKVQANNTYRITLKIEQPPWLDKGTSSGVDGFAADSFGHYIATPLKRRTLEDWFKPIVRIGQFGKNEFVLQPIPPRPEYAGDKPSIHDSLSTIIEPKLSGELFLHVNDAVLPLLGSTKYFYDNNRGTAAVTIEHVVPAYDVLEGDGPNAPSDRP